MFRRRVYLHECFPDQTGHTKWQADWRTKGGSAAYAVESDERSSATKSCLLNHLDQVLLDTGIKRYKLVEVDCCADCCTHL